MAAIQSSVTLNQSILWQPANEAAQHGGLTMALAGLPGSGKTTYSAAQDTLILDFEGGADVLSHRTDVQIWPPKDPRTGKRKDITWDSFNKVNKRLLSGDHPFTTVVFDTTTKHLDFAVRKVTKGARDNEGIPVKTNWDDYRRANSLITDVIHEWCVIAKREGTNVVFVVHIKEVKIQDDEIKIRLNLTPEVTTEIIESVDCIGVLEKLPQKPRKLITVSTNKYIAKYRQAPEGPQLPPEVDDKDEELSLQRLIDFRKKALNIL